mmetsp:Transcript_39872/g.124673  ORF Transcript_39872/g.124673 Transcript_39872/m.124673 type:complete len:350 (+) Transcript_39872:360-1409(+)
MFSKWTLQLAHARRRDRVVHAGPDRRCARSKAQRIEGGVAREAPERAAKCKGQRADLEARVHLAHQAGIRFYRDGLGVPEAAAPWHRLEAVPYGPRHEHGVASDDDGHERARQVALSGERERKRRHHDLVCHRVEELAHDGLLIPCLCNVPVEPVAHAHERDAHQRLSDAVLQDEPANDRRRQDAHTSEHVRHRKKVVAHIVAAHSGGSGGRIKSRGCRIRTYAGDASPAPALPPFDGRRDRRLVLQREPLQPGVPLGLVEEGDAAPQVARGAPGGGRRVQQKAGRAEHRRRAAQAPRAHHGQDPAEPPGRGPAAHLHAHRHRESSPRRGAALPILSPNPKPFGTTLGR